MSAKHTTGYLVWTYGTSPTWHRTWEGAERAAVQAQAWCSDVQIDDCATGERAQAPAETWDDRTGEWV